MGNRRTESRVGPADGKTYKMKGNLAWDAAAYKVVNDHTYEITDDERRKSAHHWHEHGLGGWQNADSLPPSGRQKGNKFSNKGVYDKQ